MKRLMASGVIVLAFVLLPEFAPRAQAQTSTGSGSAPADTAAKAPPPAEPKESKIYYGGSAVLGFGNPTHVGFYPSLAYKLTRKLSIGAEIGYEYLKYDGYKEGQNNYGASVFTRYRVIPQLYAHAEFQEVSTEILAKNGLGDSSRELVPYLLLGGGLVKPISQRTSAYFEVLFDVLQDENSPYKSGDPFITLGVSVGF